MSNQFESSSPRAARPLTLRAEQPDDESLLFEIYAATRRAELDLTDWDAATRLAFLQMQFRTMRQGYAGMFPDADFFIILLDARPVGRIVVHRTAEAIRVVDMALLPSEQGRGIGTQLMRHLLSEATKTRKSVRLQVLKNNRAKRFYERMGFHRVSDSGSYEQMEWKPGG
jgi:GNAT superfamily N-acetyltransferase